MSRSIISLRLKASTIDFSTMMYACDVRSDLAKLCYFWIKATTAQISLLLLLHSGASLPALAVLGDG